MQKSIEVFYQNGKKYTLYLPETISNQAQEREYLNKISWAISSPEKIKSIRLRASCGIVISSFTNKKQIA